MKSAVYFISNCLFALVFLNNSSEGVPFCDLNWIRHTFMLSCGRKKRETIWDRTIWNEERLEALRKQAENDYKFFYDYDPNNPEYIQDQILEEVLRENPKTRLPQYMMEEYAPLKTRRSSLVQRINPSRRTLLGTENFPDLWDSHEEEDDEIIVNVRSGMEQMVNQCCSTDVRKQKCDLKDFMEACKK